MSYLTPPYFTFEGQFRADIPTVNNDVRHYDNRHFEKRFQLLQTVGVNNGRWNPEGSGVYEFRDVKVSQYSDEANIQGPDESLRGASLHSGLGMAAGKMVDLDPQMQMTSELWGVKISLLNREGRMLFEGDLLPCGFRDMQVRQIDGDGKPNMLPNDVPMGADYYSVLENVIWGNITESKFLKNLKEETEGNKLRIKMNHFGFDLTHTSDRFLIGNIIGFIGPWKMGQALLMSNERRLHGTNGVIFQYTNFNLNKSTHLVSIDMGMSIPLENPLGKIHTDYTDFVVGLKSSSADFQQGEKIRRKDVIVLHEFSISERENWLKSTCGLVRFSLKEEHTSLLESNALMLFKPIDEHLILLAQEPMHGYFLRADQYIHRIDAGETKVLDLYAFKWGKAVKGIEPVVTLDPESRGVGSNRNFDLLPPKAKIPPINTPSDAIEFKVLNPTDENGKCQVSVRGGNPGRPRDYLDGQIYLASYFLKNLQVSELKQYPFDKIAVHLRDACEILEKPRWTDIKDTWVQFGNLYPVMSKYIANFSDPNAILQRRELFLFSLQKDMRDPMYMPVSRNLSKAKMTNMINWLKNGELDNTEEEKKDTFGLDLTTESGITDQVHDSPESFLIQVKVGMKKPLENDPFLNPKNDQVE